MLKIIKIMHINSFKNIFKMNPGQTLGLVLITATILFSPFYFYASGLPQPSHIFIFIVSLIILFINKSKVIEFCKFHKSGVAFLCLLLLINITYLSIYENISFLLNSSYWMFNFILFVAVIITIRDRVVIPWISLLIAIKFSMIVFSYFFGWGGYTFWPRYDYFFNGPNQLAYFAICLFLVFIVTTRLGVNFVFISVYSMLILIVISSGGRSAYFAIVPMMVIMAWRLRKKISSIILIAIIPLMVNLGFNFFELPNFSSNQRISTTDIKSEDAANRGINSNPNNARSLAGNVAEETATRILNLTLDEDDHLDSIVLQLTARGYLRAVDHPLYLLFGAGQGYEERFIDKYGFVYEIHSSFFAIIFYYGILGLLLFVHFIWNLFKYKINIVFLLPLVAYGLFTYGLRSPYFWFALAFLSTAHNLFQLVFDDQDN